jgi:multidrug efflux system membrane fusion protein
MICRVLSSFFVLIVALLCGCKAQKVQSTGGPPPVPVSVAVATQEIVSVELQVIGTTEPSAAVQVRSQVAGQLLKVNFSEGQSVRQGDLLFEIDSRPFRETLRQAEAALARDNAQLRHAEATLARDIAQSKNADADAARYDELAKAGVISKAQHDQVRTAADMYRESVRAAQAAIESARAAIQADEAAIARAKLDISYCNIHAPISGRTGNLLVHAGNLVKANDTVLVAIHQIVPIFVNFSVAEQHLSAIRKSNAAGPLPVRVSPQDQEGATAQGRLSVVDNTVDPATGTIRLKATMPNSEGLLWPGQFVNVVLTLGTQHNATVVPAEAVQAGQEGQFLYVVKPDKTVEPRNVSIGRTLERKIVIDSGVSPGETVVTDGQLRLFPGARIQAVELDKVRPGKPL